MEDFVEGLIFEYGYANGLIVRDGAITEWPSEWPPKPTDSEISTIVENFKLPKTKRDLIIKTRKECRDRIRALFPRLDGSLRDDIDLLFEQNNLQSEAQRLFGIERERLNSGGTRPILDAEHDTRIAELKQLEINVRNVRTKCKALKALINAASTIAELEYLNIKDDYHWI